MSQVTAYDLNLLRQHRKIWEVRPELRSVYREWFDRLLHCVSGRAPIIEIGSGPGFFKEYFPGLISTDLISSPWVDAVCDAQCLPFPSNTVGALVMVDVLHHLSKPLEFMAEASRVLQVGGRLAMIEPWITPLSFLLYRYFHHEDCCLRVDLECPFKPGDKKAFDGNATIPFLLVRIFKSDTLPLRLIKAHASLALPYLVTLGFKRSRTIPCSLVNFAKVCERLLDPLRKFAATRIILVWEKRS